MKPLHLLLFLLLSPVLQSQECLDIDYQLRGYFYAGSAKKDPNALGGFYQDKNNPTSATTAVKEQTTASTLSIVVMPDAATPFSETVAGFSVWVVNQSGQTLGFPAQDSRLSMIRQVQHRGTWRDLEYLPSSWCGNSYHEVFIRDGQYWSFVAPCLTGSKEGEFRFKLTGDEGKTYYSHTFVGQYNPGQWKKEQGHTPQGLMDPYNN